MDGDDLNVYKDSVTKSLNQLSRLCFRLRKAQSVISIIYVLQMGVSLIYGQPPQSLLVCLQPHAQALLW